MALHFHPLVISNIEKETSDCVVVSFLVPDALQETFRFAHGQNITLKTDIDGLPVRRSYSICSAPFEKELQVAIKKVPGGVFSTYANTLLKPGDMISVLPPTGKFYTVLNPARGKKYVAFACGSGITPVLSIIKTSLHEEPQSEFILIYSNRSRSSIIFFEALEALKNKYMNRFTLIHLLSREKTETTLNFGRIDPEKLSALNRIIHYETVDDFFICGPEEMIMTTKKFLENSGIPDKKIHFELFAASTAKKQINKPEAVADNTHKSKITVKLDGRYFEFNLAFGAESILDAALQQGADLPYACKGGVCCTCKAKLLEGEVLMDVNYALEPEEVAEGFILTCQSHPTTEKVVVDFDIK
jgi:ring-1,2-phenylacetyl-CoA epoxidase subunit PaaE